jgi:hypothetical protein
MEATSVHWFAIKQLPIGFFRSAVAAYIDHNKKTIIDASVIEAIETPETQNGHGASMIATQYHPEATRTELPGHTHAHNHHRFFHSMLQEGDARNKHRIINKEIKYRNLPFPTYLTSILHVPRQDIKALGYKEPNVELTEPVVEDVPFIAKQ